jgi:hypothetical protein
MKSARLLGASAGVCAVHQSALIVHEVAQVWAGAGQSLTKVIASDFRHLGGYDIGDPEDPTEDVGQALIPIEAEEHTGRTSDHCFGHEQVSVCGHVSRIGEF